MNLVRSQGRIDRLKKEIQEYDEFIEQTGGMPLSNWDDSCLDTLMETLKFEESLPEWLPMKTAPKETRVMVFTEYPEGRYEQILVFIGDAWQDDFGNAEPWACEFLGWKPL